MVRQAKDSDNRPVQRRDLCVDSTLSDIEPARESGAEDAALYLRIGCLQGGREPSIDLKVAIVVSSALVDSARSLSVPASLLVGTEDQPAGL